MATLTASTCIYRQTRVAETHIELAKYQQREGKFSDAVVLATAKTMAPASWWALYGKHVPCVRDVCTRQVMWMTSTAAFVDDFVSVRQPHIVWKLSASCV